MTDEPGSSEGIGARALERIQRLEIDQRRTRWLLLAVTVVSFAGWLCSMWLVTRRRVIERAGTIVAERFILQHEGRPRAELSMQRGGLWAQLRLGGPEDQLMPEGRPYVLLGEQGQVIANGPGGTTTIWGGTVISGQGDRIDAGFGHWGGDTTWWRFSSDRSVSLRLGPGLRPWPARESLDSLSHQRPTRGEPSRP